jgi:hypothetical protein
MRAMLKGAPWLLLISLAASTTARGNDDDAEGWSEPSNGVRGRLVMRCSHVINGTMIVATHVELKNVWDVANALAVDVSDKHFTFRVTDAEGKDLPDSPAIFSGIQAPLPDLILPFDGSIRFRIGPRGFGIAGDKAALLDLGPNFGREIPKDGKTYFLRGVFEVPKMPNNRTGPAVRWQGRIELPPVRIPTQPDPIDPATLGPIIEAVGARLVTGDESAVREMSLIDDPRVAPWYIKAVQTRNYSLKLTALDRLSRMEGDDALSGIEIGMRTMASDIANTNTLALAVTSAEAVRHSAALALARSPHPRARSLLFSMEKDPARSVRLTVVQAAARINTPESLAIVQRGTQDNDGTIRREATRLLNAQNLPAD